MPRHSSKRPVFTMSKGKEKNIYVQMTTEERRKTLENLGKSITLSNPRKCKQLQKNVSRLTPSENWKEIVYYCKVV